MWVVFTPPTLLFVYDSVLADSDGTRGDRLSRISDDRGD